MVEFSLLSEKSNSTEKVSLDLGKFGIGEIKTLLYLHPFLPSKPTQPVVTDTPVDLINGNPLDFMKKLKEGKFNVEEETFMEIKEIHDTVFKEEPPIFKNPLPYFGEGLKNLKYSLKVIYEDSKNACSIFIGRSSLLLLVSVVLTEELNIENTYWLRSKNESKGGLHEYSVERGLAQLRKEIERNRYDTVVLIDDVGITGSTIDNIAEYLPNNKKIGLLLIFNPYAYISHHYPNRKVPEPRVCLKIYLDLFSQRKKSESDLKTKRIRENFNRTPKIGGLTVFAPYANTLSHITGDSIEEYYYQLDLLKKTVNTKQHSRKLEELEELEPKVRKLSYGLANRYTRLLEESIREISNEIIIIPRTR